MIFDRTTINVILESYSISLVYIIFLYILFKYIIIQFEGSSIMDNLFNMLTFYNRNNSFIVNRDAILDNINIIKRELNNRVQDVQNAVDSNNKPLESSAIAFVTVYSIVPPVILAILIYFNIIDYNIINWKLLIVTILLNIALIISFEALFLYIIFKLYVPYSIELPHD